MKRLLFAILTVAIGVLVVAGSVVVMHSRQAPPAVLEAKVVGTATTPLGSLPHATVELSIYPQSSSAVPGPTTGDNAFIDKLGWPFYWPSTTLQLPAHTLVTMTVHQYDSSTTVWNPYFAAVHGTVDGTASYNGTAQKQIKPSDVAHTFTIHQYPESSQPYFFVSVPMLAVPTNAKNEANGYPKPQDITFSFITGAPGEYVWNCEDPCGNGYVDFGGVMSQRGWMSGTVTVV
ncbi:MAG: hypothetical protein WCP95_14785 [Actinomycetes bacterium]